VTIKYAQFVTKTQQSLISSL